MEQREITRQIKDDAIRHGLCQMWRERIKPDMTMDELAQLYTTGHDFCMRNDVPNADFFRQNLKGKCEQYGVYVDDSVSDVNAKKIFLLGKSNASLHYDGHTVAQVFVKHDTSCVVMAKDFSHVTVCAYDNAKVIVNADKCARVYVVAHGEDVSIDNLSPDYKILIRKTN